MTQHVRQIGLAIDGEVANKLKLQFVLQELTPLPHLVADPDVLQTDKNVGLDFF